MRFPKNGVSIALVVALLSGLHSASTSASGIGANKPLVCSTIDVMACVDDTGCMRGAPRDFDIPTFMFINFREGKVHTAGDSKEDAASPILSKQLTEKSLILQGNENHHGWTLAVSRDDGAMKLTSLGPDLALLISGNCVTY
jgi:hypothetical protein